MSLRKHVALAFIVISFFSSVASAEITTFKFTGTVTHGSTLADIGSPISGLFIYDTSTTPTNSLAGYANYSLPAPFVISASVGGHTIVSSKLGVSIWNNYGGNVEDIVNISGASVLIDDNLYITGGFGFQLASKPGNTNVLNNTDLPSSYDVSAFDAGFSLNYGWLQSSGAEGGQLLQFSVNSITVPQKCNPSKK